MNAFCCVATCFVSNGKKRIVCRKRSSFHSFLILSALTVDSKVLRVPPFPSKLLVHLKLGIRNAFMTLLETNRLNESGRKLKALGLKLKRSDI